MHQEHGLLGAHYVTSYPLARMNAEQRISILSRLFKNKAYMLWIRTPSLPSAAFLTQVVRERHLSVRLHSKMTQKKLIAKNLEATCSLRYLFCSFQCDKAISWVDFWVQLWTLNGKVAAVANSELHIWQPVKPNALRFNAVQSEPDVIYNLSSLYHPPPPTHLY